MIDAREPLSPDWFEYYRKPMLLTDFMPRMTSAIPARVIASLDAL